jgi:hypothetical protein
MEDEILFCLMNITIYIYIYEMLSYYKLGYCFVQMNMAIFM